MKLYYSPGACSLAADIVLREAKIDADYVKVDLKSHKTEKGDDYTTTVGGSSASAIRIRGTCVDSQGRSFAQPTRLRLPSL